MHIFLTGEIQVGKSTVINKTIRLLEIKYGGFKTYFGHDRNSENKTLYINSADESKEFNEDKILVQFIEGKSPFVNIQKFNTYGCQLIRDARKKSDLILMDECGKFESKALDFQSEIYKTLDESKPVLGVVRLSSKGWTDRIRNHPKVKIITVTKENRNQLPRMLYNHFKR